MKCSVDTDKQDELLQRNGTVCYFWESLEQNNNSLDKCVRDRETQGEHC